MGLDFSHTDAHFSYGGFDRFREALAEHEGIKLRDMAGFCAPWRGDDPQTHPSLPWDAIDTPLKPLLNHSDCDGDLSPEECAQIAPRLRQVIAELWPEGHENGLALAEAMEVAAAAGERLEFQ